MKHDTDLPPIDDRWIVQQRGPRNEVDPHRPYACFVEPERTAEGSIEDVATIFLTNKECPYRCLMCDLWKNTTEGPTPAGAVPAQIEWALQQLPPAQHVKLYNSGNFFDRQAIPKADLPRIAELVAHFKTVIIECHPRLIGPACSEFAEMLDTAAHLPTGPEPRALARAMLPSQSELANFANNPNNPPGSPLEKGGKGCAALEVAMGLETVDPDVLPRLNKRMTLEDYGRATKFLCDHGVAVRAFILLKTPFQTEQEGLHWAKRSIDFAFSIGVGCCAIIPTRSGNGAMNWLEQHGHFTPPSPESIEAVMEYGLSLRAGRVFLDLWDIERFFPKSPDGTLRIEGLRHMNISQNPGSFERMAPDDAGLGGIS